MKCAGCAKHVQEALEGVKGVTAVEVSLDQKSAKVTYDEEETAPAQLVDAVEEAGFKLVED